MTMPPAARRSSPAQQARRGPQTSASTTAKTIRPTTRRGPTKHAKASSSGVARAKATSTNSFISASSSSSSSSSPTSGSASGPASTLTPPSSERNIDDVLFGTVHFRTWYPSWYPKEILGEKGTSGERRGIVLTRLHVCAACFAYSTSLTDLVRHRAACRRRDWGEEIYVHPPAPGDAAGSRAAWSVRVLDGEQETVFAQNLSLFAKLFLDNKSVFFDVASFSYYLLVHTSTDGIQQIVGFFSKEKMSWDNNNLACILIFPPWQRKGLGALLIGVSYEISRRQGILGGPEKPISDLGRLGYHRFWGAEIARWLLRQEVGPKGRSKAVGKVREQDDIDPSVITVEDVSRGTWIVADDCLHMMREIGVVERVADASPTTSAANDEDVPPPQRVRIDKQKIRAWVRKERLKLQPVVDPAGFKEGYAMADQARQGDEEGMSEEDEDRMSIDE